jgi:predicted nucleic acid-binding protein
MFVVADTGPLRYLILIEEIQLLRSAYGRIAVPAGVLNELSQPKTPALVRAWMGNLPDWMEVRSLGSAPSQFPLKLGLGEREAITLAQQLVADALLTDDFAARTEALRRQIPVLGTLGVLDMAAEQGLVDFRTVLGKLMVTNFRAGSKLIQFFLDRDTIRRTKRSV